MKQTSQIRWFLHALCSIVVGLGCYRQESSREVRSAAAAVKTMRNGKVVLGSLHLTAGIPGEGPLSVPEIEKWLEQPEHHATLDFVLPTSLDEERGAATVPADNPLTPAKIELGRQLFFDKRLSGIGTFSCATCHQPEQFYTSHLVMPEVGRNASTIFNRILGREHFWEGRADSLESQPLSPVKNPFEMNSSPEKSTANIAAIPGYRLQFEAIFGVVSFENICKAIASFERVIVTRDSAWDRGDLTPPAKRGETLFFSDRLGCANCHSGRNFSDERYHNLGTSQRKGSHDLGRYEVTGREEDRGAFKTPSLRNVAKTAPYMHNGMFGTLVEVVDFFDQGGYVNENLSPTLQPLNLTATEKQDLIEFLRSLTSELTPVATGRLPE